MTIFLSGFGLVTLLLLAFGAGFLLATRRERARQRAHEERQARIEERTYHGGEPHNHDGPPARVSQGRVQNRRTWKLHP